MKCLQSFSKGSQKCFGLHFRHSFGSDIERLSSLVVIVPTASTRMFALRKPTKEPLPRGLRFFFPMSYNVFGNVRGVAIYTNILMSLVFGLPMLVAGLLMLVFGLPMLVFGLPMRVCRCVSF